MQKKARDDEQKTIIELFRKRKYKFRNLNGVNFDISGELHS
jgi:hypothetical protein